MFLLVEPKCYDFVFVYFLCTRVKVWHKVDFWKNTLNFIGIWIEYFNYMAIGTILVLASKYDNFSTWINRGGEHIKPNCQWSAEAVNLYILPAITFRLSINVSCSIQHFYFLTNILLNESKKDVNFVTDCTAIVKFTSFVHFGCIWPLIIFYVILGNLFSLQNIDTTGNKYESIFVVGETHIAYLVAHRCFSMEYLLTRNILE